MKRRMLQERRRGGGNLDKAPWIADPNWFQSREANLMLVDQGAILFSGPRTDGTNPYIAINNPATLPGSIFTEDADFNPTNYNNAAAIDRFSIGQASIIYKGKHRVAWAQGIYGENLPTEYVAENVCDDGISFVTTNKTTLAAADIENGTCRSHGCYHIHPDDDDEDGVLYFFTPGFTRSVNPEPIFKDLTTHLYRLDNPNTVDEVWTYVGPVGQVFPLQRPILMDDGNYIMAGGDAFTNPGIMISQGSDIILPWRKIDIKTPGFTWASLTETNIYTVVGNYLEALMREQSNLPGEQGYGFSSLSRDFGKTWTEAAPSQLLMQSKKPSCGETTEGVKFIIYCLWGLDNMMFAWDSDGDGLVDKHFELLPFSPPDAYWHYVPGTGVGAYPGLPGDPYGESGVHDHAWGYADWIDDGDYLHVRFFNGKEDIWGLRINKALALYAAEVEADSIVRFTFSEDPTNPTKADSSGNGYDGTAHGSPYRYVGPRRDTWWSTYNGSSQYIDFPHPTEIRAFNSFWMAGWVRFTTALTANRTICGQYGATVASPTNGGKGFYCFKLGTAHTAADKWTVFFSPRGGITGAYSVSYDTPVVGTDYYVYAEFNTEGQFARFVTVVGGVAEEKVATTTDTDPLPVRCYHDSSEKIFIGAAQGPSSGGPIDYHAGYISQLEMGNSPLTLAEIQAKCAADPVIDYSANGADAAAVMGQFINIASTGRRTLVQSLIQDIKNVGIWSSHLDHLYLIGAEDDQMGLIDWIAPGVSDLVRSGLPPYTTDRGYTGNGNGVLVGPRLDTAAHYRQDDAHVGCVVLTNVQEDRGELGLNGGVVLRTNTTGGNMVTGFNNSGTITTAVGSPTSIGHWMLNRGAEAGAGKYTVERDASLLLTRTQASAAIPASTLNIHTSGSSTQDTKQIFCVHVGKALDSTQRAGLRAAIATYKAALGA